MKKNIYRFYYDEPAEEVIDYIRKETKTPTERVNYGDYYCKIRGNYIRMFKYNWWIRNFVRRNFIGNIEGNENGTIISGKFKYHTIDKIACAIFALHILYGHVRIFLDDISVQEKLRFVLMVVPVWLVIGLVFAIGRVVHKKDEQAVLEILGARATKQESGDL